MPSLKESMIILKTADEIALMREGGRIAASVVEAVSGFIKPGVNALEIDQLAQKLITEHGARPSFKGFEGYKFSSCINVNEGVVHGIPKKNVVLKPGDVVKVDLGVLYKGFNTDTAFSCLVKRNGEDTEFKEEERFLKVGREALSKAIKQCKIGNRIGDISSEIQRTIESAGYGVVEELVGHGVGKSLHEDPQVPGLGKPRTGPLLREGMTLAIEVIYTMGDSEIVLDSDGWTLSTLDGKMAGLFEHTVSLSKEGVEVLTLGHCLC